MTPSNLPLGVSDPKPSIVEIKGDECRDIEVMLNRNNHVVVIQLADQVVIEQSKIPDLIAALRKFEVKD